MHFQHLINDIFIVNHVDKACRRLTTSYPSVLYYFALFVVMQVKVTVDLQYTHRERAKLISDVSEVPKLPCHSLSPHLKDHLCLQSGNRSSQTPEMLRQTLSAHIHYYYYNIMIIIMALQCHAYAPL